LDISNAEFFADISRELNLEEVKEDVDKEKDGEGW